MSDSFDFEQYWIGKLSGCLQEAVDDEIREQVLEGSQELSDQTPRRDVIQWSREAMERLEGLVDQQTRIEIMTGCACQYPVSELQDARAVYEETQDAGRVHTMLQENFESFLRDRLHLDGEQVAEIVRRGWGLAGVKKGDTIIATKIPKSGCLAEYMAETDPEKRRQIYCHCPRVRDAIGLGEAISPTYCYCGAGFYKGIWEEITQGQVEVEVLESVLGGGDVCTIKVTLPPNSE